jgi:hypothetical protein
MRQFTFFVQFQAKPESKRHLADSGILQIGLGQW